MKLEHMDLSQFRRSAISPSSLHRFSYCEASALLGGGLLCRWSPVVPRMVQGFLRHEIRAKQRVALLGQSESVQVWTVGEAIDLVQRTIRKALRDRVVLANSLQFRTFCSIVSELIPGRGCYGYPDELDCRNGTHPVVVEYKRGSPPRLGRAWEGDAVQVAAYLAGILELGFADARAVIAYWDPRGGQANVALSYTPDVHARLRATARRLDAVEKGLAKPILGRASRCRACGFADACPYSFRSVEGSTAP